MHADYLMPKTYSLNSGAKWPSDLSLVFLSHGAFKSNPALWNQVKKLVTESFEHHKSGKQSLESYVKAFMREKRGRKHALVIDRNRTVFAYWGGIPSENRARQKFCWVGHLIIRPGNRIFGHVYSKIASHLSGLGFKLIRGTRYTEIGFHAGAKMGGENLGPTRKGRLNKNPKFSFFRHRLKP